MHHEARLTLYRMKQIRRTHDCEALDSATELLRSAAGVTALSDCVSVKINNK